MSETTPNAAPQDPERTPQAAPGQPVQPVAPYGQPVQPVAPYGQPVQYGGAPAAAAAPVYRRPPLTSRQRRGAMLAGGLGFSIMGIGAGLTLIVLTALVIVLILGSLAEIIERSAESADGITDWFAMVLTDYGWVAALVALLGVIIWVAGYFTSVGILRSSGNVRATAITWSSLGIGIVASWVISGILSSFSSLAGAFPRDESEWMTFSILTGVLGGLIGIATTAAIGVFTWWWMAHTLRPKPVDAAPGAAVATPPAA